MTTSNASAAVAEVMGFDDPATRAAHIDEHDLLCDDLDCASWHGMVEAHFIEVYASRYGVSL